MGKGASTALDPTLQLTIRFDGIGPWATGFRSLHQLAIEPDHTRYGWIREKV